MRHWVLEGNSGPSCTALLCPSILADLYECLPNIFAGHDVVALEDVIVIVIGHFLVKQTAIDLQSVSRFGLISLGCSKGFGYQCLFQFCDRFVKRQRKELGLSGIRFAATQCGFAEVLPERVTLLAENAKCALNTRPWRRQVD